MPARLAAIEDDSDDGRALRAQLGERLVRDVGAHVPHHRPADRLSLRGLADLHSRRHARPAGRARACRRLRAAGLARAACLAARRPLDARPVRARLHAAALRQRCAGWRGIAEAAAERAACRSTPSTVDEPEAAEPLRTQAGAGAARTATSPGAATRCRPILAPCSTAFAAPEITRGNPSSAHSRESGNPDFTSWPKDWVPALAGTSGRGLRLPHAHVRRYNSDRHEGANPNGQDRARARHLAHADAARLRRDAGALRRDRPEDQAPRQGRPAGHLWRAAGEGRPEDGAHGRAREPRRPPERRARRHPARGADARQRQPRRADRVRRRPERELQGGLPARLRDLLRRHHPQFERAARGLPQALSRVVRAEPPGLLRG